VIIRPLTPDFPRDTYDHDMRQWWYGRPVPMAGVAGVKVAPEYRGQGVGRALMTALTDLMTMRATLWPSCSRRR
jgi:GNAT superfamily N-acetyltransferase